MKLILAPDKLPNELLPGEGIVFAYPDGTIGMIVCCPKCGCSMASITEGHKYDKETQSITPSLVHDTKFGGCGWHGWLTNGEFKDA